MNRPVLALALALAWSLPAGAAAQVTEPAAGSVHTRTRPGADTRLSLENVRLFIPAGATASGAVVALGVGGVPAADGGLQRTGVVVSAAGGLRDAVAVLIEPAPADRAALGGATPALHAPAGGASFPCATHGRWLVCPVSRVGAYVLGATGEPPPSSPLVGAALEVTDQPATGGLSPLAVRLLVILTAGVAGGALAWFFSRARFDSNGPTGPSS